MGCSPGVARVRRDLTTEPPPSLYIWWLNNQILLWSRGNCIQCPVVSHRGKGREKVVKVLVGPSCPTLCNRMDCSLPASCQWDFPGKNAGVGFHFLLQGIYIHTYIHIYRYIFMGFPVKGNIYIYAFMYTYISNICKFKYMNVLPSFQYTHNSVTLLTNRN